jgi:hypothetical protein
VNELEEEPENEEAGRHPEGAPSTRREHASTRSGRSRC